MYAGDLIDEINDLYKQVVDRNGRLKGLLELNAPAIPALCSPPFVRRRIIELLDDPERNRDEIIAVISHDPGLLAHVLRAANTAPYAASQKIDDVHDAVSALSEDDLRTLITSVTAVESFNHVATDLVDMDNFWNHSICCGLAARVLAEQCGQANPNQVFVAGVLHDIGQLVIYHDLPDLATEVLKKAGAPEVYRYRAEKEIIGITHAEVGAELIKSWGLPDYLWEVVQFHHEPDKATKYPVETALIHICSGIANRIEPSWKMNLAKRDTLDEINPYAWTVTGLSPATIQSTLEAINIESFDIMMSTNIPMPLIFSAA